MTCARLRLKVAKPAFELGILTFFPHAVLSSQHCGSFFLFSPLNFNAIFFKFLISIYYFYLSLYSFLITTVIHAYCKKFNTVEDYITFIMRRKVMLLRISLDSLMIFVVVVVVIISHSYREK